MKISPKKLYLLLVAGFIFVLCTASFSQRPPSDLKLDKFDPKLETTEVFKQKAVAFLDSLRSYEPEVRGQVNLYTSEPLGKLLLELAGSELSKRLEMLRPGIGSRNRPSNIEFWIVSKGSEGPFPIACGLCDCPPPGSIDGKAKLDGTETEIEFKAEVSGSKEPKFSWTVTGGTITKGQGTNKITVRPSPDEDIMVELEWRGDEICGCGGVAAFTSSYEREL